MARTIPELAYANHLMYAYHVDDRDKSKQNFDSSGDHGVGFHMLVYMIESTIDSTLLIVTGHCTPEFKYIGKRRMENAVKVCEKSLSDLIELLVGQSKSHSV